MCLYCCSSISYIKGKIGKGKRIVMSSSSSSSTDETDSSVTSNEGDKKLRSIREKLRRPVVGLGVLTGANKKLIRPVVGQVLSTEANKKIKLTKHDNKEIFLNAAKEKKAKNPIGTKSTKKLKEQKEMFELVGNNNVLHSEDVVMERKGKNVDVECDEDIIGDLVKTLCKENTVIATHVSFLKQMKGFVPKDKAFSRLFSLICNGPQLANGKHFSDITLMQTTHDFLIGLITDPSASLKNINNVVVHIDDGFFQFHGEVLQKELYGSSNFSKSGFSIGTLNQIKQSVHLKYCVTSILSNVFNVCFGKRFVTSYEGKLEQIYSDNVFVQKLLRNNEGKGYLCMLQMNIQSYCHVLCEYGPVFYFDEEFLKEFWDDKFNSYFEKIGSNRKDENMQLMKASFGSIQIIISNLLGNLGNCITYYSWLHTMQGRVTASDLVEQLCNIIEVEVNKATDVIVPIFSKYIYNRKNSIIKFVEEIKYSLVHNYGKNKLCNVKCNLATAMNVSERD